MATQARAGSEGVHIPFVATGLAIAILGGFVLAIVLPLSALLGAPLNWVAYGQVHGHLQVIGFVGLAIVGVSYHLLPVFAGQPIRYRALIPWSLWLIGGGVVLRAIGQPAAATSPFEVIAVLGGWCEAAGLACFAVNVLPLVVRLARNGDPAGVSLTAGVIWVLLQSVLGGWWLTEAIGRGAIALPGDRDTALVALQFFGFHVLFILGVGTRAFPVFFGAGRPTIRTIAIPATAIQGGLLFVVVGTIVGAHAVLDVGYLLLAVGIVWLTACLGWWHGPRRIRPASRPFAIPIEFALAWLTVAGLLLCWGSIEGLRSGTSIASSQLDSARHIVAVGVVLMTIVAMAQLVLPEFASERFAGRQGAWRGIGLGALLSVATVLRAGSPLGAAWGLDGRVVLWSMTVAGCIALGVMVTFAVLFARSVRSHRALLARIASVAERGQTWPIAPVNRDW